MLIKFFAFLMFTQTLRYVKYVEYLSNSIAFYSLAKKNLLFTVSPSGLIQYDITSLVICYAIISSLLTTIYIFSFENS